jgi:hypothetical protein
VIYSHIKLVGGLGFGSRVWILANELVGLLSYLIFRVFILVVVFLYILPQISLINCEENLG